MLVILHLPVVVEAVLLTCQVPEVLLPLLRQVLLPLLRQVLEEGIAAGEFRAIDTDMTPLLIIGMVRGGIMLAGDRPRAALERAVLDLVLTAAAVTTNPFFAAAGSSL